MNLNKSIINRYFGLVILVLILAVAVSGFLSINSAFKLFSEETQKTLIREARLMAELLPDSLSIEAVDSILIKYHFDPQIRFTFIDNTGRVMVDTDEDPAKMDNHANRPEIVAAFSDGEGSSIRFSATLKEHLVYSALRVNDSLVIRASKPLISVSGFKKRHVREVIPLMFGLIIAGVIITILSKSAIANKISGISKTARQISKGDFSARLKESGDSEFNQLEKSINQMAGEIEKLFATLKAQKDEMSIILDSLRDSIILIRNSKIVALNNSAEKALHLKRESVLGNDALSTIRIPEIVGLIETKSNKPIEFDLDDTRVEAAAFPSLRDDSLIIVIKDIGEQYKIRKIKTDFVANVSHELKTPLTVIKGYAETLESESLDDEQRKAIDIIERHTNRMIAIVEDLLTLTEVESTAVLSSSPISLPDVIDAILPMFTKLATKAEVTISTNFADDVPKIQGDPSLIEIAMANLIDNAVKYNKKGGRVLIECYREGDDVAVAVEDSGIGIPFAEREKVFERFYTVDKAHSHKLGGTGLGLSIVKNIVCLHGGQIHLDCQRIEGCRFKMVFPIKPLS
ncbi:HAMP domain-containing protein [bacterium]|nr:HAMP domain-containing protein [bacterium]